MDDGDVYKIFPILRRRRLDPHSRAHCSSHNQDILMPTDFELLIDHYDSGRLSRRELLGALAMLALPVTAESAVPKVAVAKQINHATLYVRDVEQSREFYQRLFGMPVLTAQSPGFNLRIGSGFIGVYPSDPGESPRIDHVCFGVDHFDADATQRKLTAEGVNATIRVRGDTKELYFTDPNGLRMQLQDVRYTGGGGPLGDRKP
jgi:catechol 2,3-dioxygenase-like lactoylglutathione lyase family enzyme